LRRAHQPKQDRKYLYVDIVRQRMKILYTLAIASVKQGDIEYARKLGELIKRMHQETRVKIPIAIKRGLCKNCNVPLIPGVTARVRLRTQGRFSYIVVKCLVCGWIHRYPYKRG
jgi:ribonuclease P protein subunit RPR2